MANRSAALGIALRGDGATLLVDAAVTRAVAGRGVSCDELHRLATHPALAQQRRQKSTAALVARSFVRPAVRIGYRLRCRLRRLQCGSDDHDDDDLALAADEARWRRVAEVVVTEFQRCVAALGSTCTDPRGEDVERAVAREYICLLWLHDGSVDRNAVEGAPRALLAHSICVGVLSDARCRWARVGLLLCAFPGGSHVEISAPLVTALLDEAASLRSALIETDRDWALPQRGSALREQIACELDAVVACALQIGLASSTSRDAVRAVLQSLAEGLGSAPELAHICDAAMRGAQLLSPQTPSMLRQIFASPRAVDAFIERVVCGSESELVDAAVGQEEEEEEGGDSSNSERQLEALSGSCDPIHITCSFRVDASSVQPEEEGKRAIVVSVTATNVSGGSAKSLALALAIQGDLHPAGASSASRQLATLPAGATTRWDVRLLAHSVGWCSLQVLVELNGAVVGSTRRANVGGDGEEEEEEGGATSRNAAAAVTSAISFCSATYTLPLRCFMVPPPRARLAPVSLSQQWNSAMPSWTLLSAISIATPFASTTSGGGNSSVVPMRAMNDDNFAARLHAAITAEAFVAADGSGRQRRGDMTRVQRAYLAATCDGALVGCYVVAIRGGLKGGAAQWRARLELRSDSTSAIAAIEARAARWVRELSGGLLQIAADAGPLSDLSLAGDLEASTRSSAEEEAPNAVASALKQWRELNGMPREPPRKSKVAPPPKPPPDPPVSPPPSSQGTLQST
jgi:hypothetical protein